MNYKQFLSKVQEYSGLPKDDSLKVTRAVLGTVGERLSSKHREHLAAQLPGELRPFALEYPATDLVSLEVFYQRVGSRAALSFHDSVKHSRTVFRVLTEAIAPGEIKDVFSELPPEYADLLGRRPEQISPSTVDTHDLYPER